MGEVCGCLGRVCGGLVRLSVVGVLWGGERGAGDGGGDLVRRLGLRET